MIYEKTNDLFLGFDLSTQQLKIIVTDEQLKHLESFSVEFDKTFKDKYGIEKGVLANEKTGEIVSPVGMWLDAIDFLFTAMKKKEFPFYKVKGISGSGQQHGSVFWAEGALDVLKNLNSKEPLSAQLADTFSYLYSPNWQDHSTGQEAKAFEACVGGPDNLASITGSRAHHRFTGLQIRKMATRKGPEKYEKTLRISLVSNFLASILQGKLANIEQAEACGMNIYDIEKEDYDDSLLAVAAGAHTGIDGVSEEESRTKVTQLRSKLGNVDPVSYESIGSISLYFVEKYGLNSNTKVYSFTGDNLATIISLPLGLNDILMSLGTSTTALLVTENYKPSSQYHLFKHPTMRGYYMGMICYCNGSLARERVRNEVNEKYGVRDNNSWSKFDSILDSSHTFNNELGIYFPLGEIVPNAPAQYKRCKLVNENELLLVDNWDVDKDVSSIVESQTLSCRLRAGPMIHHSFKKRQGSDESLEKKVVEELYQQLHRRFGDLYTDGKKQNFESLTSRPNKVFYVGGASNNKSIISKMGSILGSTNGNYKVEIPNACALGGAYKASWSFLCEQKMKWVPFEDYINKHFNYNDLESIKVEDHWKDYFTGIGMLAKMEESLKKN